MGASDVAVLRDLTTAYRRADNRSGGGAVREKLVRTLHHEVAPLLKHGRFDARNGRALATTAAEMTQLAGWMAYDCGLHGLAQRYFVQAHNLAGAASAGALGGEVLAAMAHQAAYVGHPSATVSYARAAGRAGARAGHRHLVAEAAALEAQGHARAGDERAVSHALSRAESELEHADQDNGPEYLSYLDEAYLSAKFGHVFRELGRGPETTRFAARSLDMRPGFERGRVFNLALLAHGHALSGNIEECLAAGSAAVRLGAEIQSVRAVEYLRAVSVLLKPHQAHAPVAQFRGRVRYLRPAVLHRAPGVQKERPQKRPR